MAQAAGNEAAKRQQEALAEMERTLSAASQKLVTTVDGMSKGQIEAVDSMQKTLAALANASTKHVHEIDDQLAQTRLASGKLVNEIVGLADIVAEKLA